MCMHTAMDMKVSFMVGVSFRNAYKNKYVKNRLKDEKAVRKNMILKNILRKEVAKTPKAR